MKKFLALIVAVFALAACDQRVPQGIPNLDQVSNAAPQMAPQQSGGGIDGGSAAVGAVAGAVGGYMLGKAATPTPSQTIIVDRRPVYNSYGSGYGSGYRPSSSFGKTTTTTTTTKRSMFGGTKTITRSVTRRR